jgi:hypothetical protein
MRYIFNSKRKNKRIKVIVLLWSLKGNDTIESQGSKGNGMENSLESFWSHFVSDEV